MRLRAIILVLGLIGAACGGNGDSADSTFVSSVIDGGDNDELCSCHECAEDNYGANNHHHGSDHDNDCCGRSRSDG